MAQQPFSRSYRVTNYLSLALIILVAIAALFVLIHVVIIGVVFNIDPHYLDGSHWIALFININTEEIFYFDSNGDRVPRHIKKLVKTITKQGEEEDIDFKFDCNHPFEHQQSDTECGIYVLYFLVNSIKETKPLSFYKKHRISDDAMERLRRIYFNQ